MHGWECPKCKTVWAPSVVRCTDCSPPKISGPVVFGDFGLPGGPTFPPHTHSDPRFVNVPTSLPTPANPWAAIARNGKPV